MIKGAFRALSLILPIFSLSLSYGAPKKNVNIEREGTVKLTQQRIIAIADELMNQYAISYAYGGSQIRSPELCSACNECLKKKKLSSKKSLSGCPVCRECSLDCSHFTHLVYERAGLRLPYLPTATMLSLSDESLRKNYRLLRVAELSKAQPGDLLVYQGHVVLLEDVLATGRGTVVHATGGRAIRQAGEGIQRERNVVLASFRGPLRRVLRHLDMSPGTASQMKPPAATNKKQARVPAKFAPLPKRQKTAN